MERRIAHRSICAAKPRHALHKRNDESRARVRAHDDGIKGYA
jgi:hypothetical protein